VILRYIFLRMQFGAFEGGSKAVADGYYIIIQPITKGNHNIEFKASLICRGADCLASNFVKIYKIYYNCRIDSN
jgi:hypothetical protein